MLSEEKKTTIRRAFFATVPIMAGYLVMGFAFGIMLTDKGYSCLWTLLMGATIYCGAMQYVAVDLLSTGAGLISVAVMTFLVNARHLIYGISMLERFRGMGKSKLYLMFGLTDETYALLCGNLDREKEQNKKTYALTVALLDQLYWVTGCFLGGAVGSVISFSTAGIDFAMTALFIVIFTEQWLNGKDHLPAILGVVITVLCLVIFGSKNFLIPAMILIVTSLSVVEFVKKKNKGVNKDE